MDRSVRHHAIEKYSYKVPPADTALAKARFKDFRSRMDTDPRVPPRATGHDAPAKQR